MITWPFFMSCNHPIICNPCYISCNHPKLSSVLFSTMISHPVFSPHFIIWCITECYQFMLSSKLSHHFITVRYHPILSFYVTTPVITCYIPWSSHVIYQCYHPMWSIFYPPMYHPMESSMLSCVITPRWKQLLFLLFMKTTLNCLRSSS
jgi:hypothetical protein